MPYEPHWYAVRTQHHHEKSVAELLRGKGLEEFLPLYHARRAWSDRVKELDLPLFPGYLFCRFRAAERGRVLATPSVAGIAGCGRYPTPVSEPEIAAVRAIVHSGLAAEPCPYLRVGDPVRIVRGPLRGMTGQLVEVRNSARLVVTVELLMRSVSVRIDRDMVARAPAAA